MKSVLVLLGKGFREGGAPPLPEPAEGKFVVIRAGLSVEFVVLACGNGFAYHADVAEAFCTGGGRNLAGRREEGRFLVDEPGWAVAGGGRFRLDPGERTLRLHGRSIAYGRFDGEGLAERLSALPRLSGYVVTVSP